MKGNRYSKVGILDRLIGMLLTGQKKKRKWRESFAIFMFIASDSIFKSII